MPVSGGEKKMLDVQLQIRENQQELQDYLRDLSGWEDEMKQKDETLKRKGTGGVEAKLPPVRNSLHKKKKKKKTDASQNNELSSTSKRISSYDYKAWDKFDVELCCQEIDNETAGRSSSEDETDDEWEEERMKQQALLEKNQGNELFKSGNYELAVEYYTRGLELDAGNPVIAANRAMALLKLNRFAAAEVDCSTSLLVDPTYIKAYLRRGTARCGQKKFEEAKSDFHKVLKLEPDNKKAKQELESIEKVLMETGVSSKSEKPVIKNGCVPAIYKSPEERSKKPLRRIIIKEIGTEDDSKLRKSILSVTSNQGQLKKEMTARDEQEFEHFTVNREAKKDQNDQKCVENVVCDKGTSESDFSSASGTQQTVGLNSDKRVHYHSPDILKTVSTGTRELNQKNTVSSTFSTTHKTCAPSSGATLEIPNAPVNSFQFQTSWKILKCNQQALYLYCKKINPQNYAKLLGKAIDSEILYTFGLIFHNFFIPGGEDIYPCLRHLADVNRFSVAVMLLSTKEKQVFSELFQHLRNNSTIPASELQVLARKYDVKC